MFGILSPVSELEWASCSHEVLSSPMLVSLAVGFPEKNKRVVSFFFCPALAIKAIKEKKNPSFFPPSPQSLCLTAEEFPTLKNYPF